MTRYKAQFEKDRVIFTDKSFKSPEDFIRYAHAVNLERELGQLISVTRLADRRAK